MIQIVKIKPKSQAPAVEPPTKAEAKPKPQKPKAVAQKKPQAKQQGAKFFQSIACVRGVLDVAEKRARILFEDGSHVSISSIRDSNLFCWLVRNPGEWQGQERNWILYPNFKNFALACHQNENQDIVPPGQFRVSGILLPPKEGIDQRMIRVNRNDPRFKDYALVSIAGDFTNFKNNSFVQIRGTIQGFRLTATEIEEG
ncbi:hypothetical protein H6F89_00045 [Cyanobacteria bacterium FACHB-63]|nr:hypothetical protein [Cyanobacteria bacterium FACHB-63]